MAQKAKIFLDALLSAVAGLTNMNICNPFSDNLFSGNF